MTETLWCYGHEVEHPVSAFYAHPTGYRKSSRGYGPRCKQWISENTWPGKRALLLKGEWEQLFAEQDSRCAGCETDSSHRWTLDHDHGHCERHCERRYGCRECIRGILCFHCNLALGHLGDDPETLQRAAYLLTAQRPALPVGELPAQPRQTGWASLNEYRRKQTLLNPGFPHGLTREQYDALLPDDGLCPCCQKSPESWIIDHDHSCCPGSKGCQQCVRGVLCKSCNSALGYLRDSALIAYKLIDYLPQRPFANREVTFNERLKKIGA